MRSYITPALSRPKRPLAHYVNALSPRLRRMARYYARRTGHDSDDLLQEAWIGVIAAWEKLNETIGEPEQFLLQHARWRLLTYARRAGNRTMLPLPDDHAAPDGQISAAQLYLDFQQQVQHLSPSHQRIVRGLLQEMTWREIGHQLGCTSANVAYHMRTIRARLSNLSPQDDKVSEDECRP